MIGLLQARWSPLVLAAGLLAGTPAPGQDVYVPNQGTDDLTVFDSLDPTDLVTRPLGNEPHEGLATLDARYVFVSNRQDGTVAVFDAVQRIEIDTDFDASNGITRIAVGTQPHGLAITPDNRHLFVTNDGSNDVSVIDVATFSVAATVSGVGQAPHMVAISPDGREAWVGNIFGGDVSILDVTAAVADPGQALICAVPGGAGAQCRIPAGAGTEGVAFTHDGRTVYAANGGAGTVTVIDARSRTVLDNLVVPGGPRRVHVRPDGLRAYVTQLFGNRIDVIDTATHQLLPAEAIDDVPGGLGFDFRADGSRMYVANFFASMVTSIDLPQAVDRRFIATGNNPDAAILLPDTVFDLVFPRDKSLLTWRMNFLAESFDVYRGQLSALPDHGSCVNAEDDDTTDVEFVDPTMPPTGEAWTYLVATRHHGIAGILGHASNGALRQPAAACP